MPPHPDTGPAALDAPVLSAGALARAAALSDKAVRLYLDRGLLTGTADPRTGRRSFGRAEVARARTIGLLRSIDLSLAQIRDVLDADDPVDAFDTVWSARRRDLRERLRVAEQARAVLAAARPAPIGPVQFRQVPEQLTLAVPVRADLGQVPAAIREASGRLFDALGRAGVELAAAPYVEYTERATGAVDARLVVHAPVTAVLRPPAPGMRLSVEAAHAQAYLPLTQHQADDQRLVVAVHDHLSTGAFATDVVPAGNNREVYLPGFATGATGPVMEVAVPVVVR
ncbi:MAG: MerR family transcriptional regulator [Actinobacteria bacterium]|nr:MerR family transcriptional regulator [Actinomycetota bacterium]